MKVKDLVKELLKMPQDAETSHVWNGAARTSIELVWLSKSGDVVTSDYGELVSHDEDRPIDAPTRSEVHAWYTQNDPNKSDDD